MRIAMMGSGGLGGYFGGRMAQVGADVTFIARGAHLAAIRKKGLRIKSKEIGDAHIHPAQATDLPTSIGKVDYVIVAVKLWDTADAGRAILPLLGPNTTVLSLQNGVECDEELASIVGADRLIGGVAFIASSISAPGVINHIGTLQRVVIGEPEGDQTARITALRDEMIVAGIAAEISPNIQRTIWEKFVFLVGLSATTSLRRTTIGPIRNNKKDRALLRQIFTESSAVGRSKGVNLPEKFADNCLDFVDNLPAEMTSSMHHDLEAGRQMELEWLSGAVVRFGRELGVKTPANQQVYNALMEGEGGRNLYS